MKKLPFIAALSIGTMFTTSAWAANCTNADCASLGYSSSLPANCLDSINCPFDTNYKACVSYKNEWLDSCPAGKTCETKYKVTGENRACPKGTVTLSEGRCVPASCYGLDPDTPAGTKVPDKYSCSGEILLYGYDDYRKDIATIPHFKVPAYIVWPACPIKDSSLQLCIPFYALRQGGQMTWDDTAYEIFSKFTSGEFDYTTEDGEHEGMPCTVSCPNSNNCPAVVYTEGWSRVTNGSIIIGECRSTTRLITYDARYKNGITAHCIQQCTGN